MSFIFDRWYRKNRLIRRYMAMSLRELRAAYEEETIWVFGLKSAIDIKIFTYLLRLADINGDIKFTPEQRKRLAQFLDISMQQITNSLSSLKKEELIEGERRKYKILL